MAMQGKIAESCSSSRERYSEHDLKWPEIVGSADLAYDESTFCSGFLAHEVFTRTPSKTLLSHSYLNVKESHAWLTGLLLRAACPGDGV